MSSRIHVPLTKVEMHPLILSPRELEEMRRNRVQLWRHTRENDCAFRDGVKAGALLVAVPAAFLLATMFGLWMGW